MTDLLIRGADVIGGGRSDLVIRNGRFVDPADVAADVGGWMGTDSSRCRAWSTCTPTCVSLDARTPRRCNPARWLLRAADSPPSWRWPTPPR